MKIAMITLKALKIHWMTTMITALRHDKKKVGVRKRKAEEGG